LLQEILELGLSGQFPNITISLRIFFYFAGIFVRLPTSGSLGERNFKVLKQVKDCCRSTMGQHRLNGFVIFSIAQKLDFLQ
jgi:hypothetical protein